MDISEIAVAFSNGKFNESYEYLNEDIIWEVIGEKTFKGKQAVIQNCQQTANYFSSVETVFTTEDVQVMGNKVMVRGTAQFKRDGKQVNFIKACDLYEFTENGKLIKIHSYCIPIKN